MPEKRLATFIVARTRRRRDDAECVETASGRVVERGKRSVEREDVGASERNGAARRGKAGHVARDAH